MDRILELSAFGTTVKFDKLLRKGADIVEELPAPPPVKITDEPELKLDTPEGRKPVAIPGRHRVRDHHYVPKNLQGRALWDTTGAGRILNSYEKVEEALLHIGDSLGIDAARGSSIIEVLRQKKILSKEWVDLYKVLQNGRNLIAHARALPADDEITEYERQADYLNAQLVFVQYEIDKGEIQ